MIAVYILGALALVVLVAVLWLGRSGAHITTGRWGRAARMSRLIARLSSSWLGAKLRMGLMSPERRARYSEARRKADAAALTRTMGQMKGALMKLGQMLSFVSDGIPAEYRAALKSLQTSAPPMDFALLRDVAERELGKPLERAFARFDAEPLASASIGQVHRAQLPSGEEVVVKIQYPGVADAIRADLANVGMMYRMMALMYPGLEPGPVVAELRSRLEEELDYAHEAQNQMAFYDLYRDHPFIRVPQVFASHSTAHVITSEYVEGRTFADIVKLDPDTRNRYGEILYRFVFGSIIRFGVFNGDPHPGNYLFADDGRMVFLDYGCIKYFPEKMLADWMKLIHAYMHGERDEFCALAAQLGFLRSDTELPADLVFDYFSYFYRPVEKDEPFTFSHEYNNKSVNMVFKPEGRFVGFTKKANLPPDFVFVNRLQWGVFSILSELDATANWHAIHREYLFGDAPRTELGRAERAYRSAWLAERGLGAAQHFSMSPQGPKPRAVQRVTPVAALAPAATAEPALL